MNQALARAGPAGPKPSRRAGRQVLRAAARAGVRGSVPVPAVRRAGCGASCCQPRCSARRRAWKRRFQDARWCGGSKLGIRAPDARPAAVTMTGGHGPSGTGYDRRSAPRSSRPRRQVLVPHLLAHWREIPISAATGRSRGSAPLHEPAVALSRVRYGDHRLGSPQGRVLDGGSYHQPVRWCTPRLARVAVKRAGHGTVERAEVSIRGRWRDRACVRR